MNSFMWSAFVNNGHHVIVLDAPISSEIRLALMHAGFMHEIAGCESEFAAAKAAARIGNMVPFEVRGLKERHAFLQAQEAAKIPAEGKDT